MVRRQLAGWVVLQMVILGLTAAASAQQAGSIRGMVYDNDFKSPLAAARVRIAETNESVTVTDAGNYVFGQVPPGNYTLVFTKDGYTQMVKSNVVVSAGQMTEVDAWLSGDFTDMDEFVVQDLEVGGGEVALLQLRAESPSLIDSLSSDLMSRAAAGDAADALKLVAGASVQDGKFAVVRGLPDRYVNSQMNGVRLPTADADKRAVQLDQFPTAVIDNIQVSKTFTPDQQGDASGGAVNVILKGIPDQTTLKFSLGSGMNSQVAGEDDFLTYHGGGIGYWGKDKRAIPEHGHFSPIIGVSRDEAPIDYNWSLAAGGKRQCNDDIKIGGFGNFYYKRKSSFYKDGVDNAYWVLKPGDPMTPQYSQGTPDQGDFKTSLFDVAKGTEEVQWGGLGTMGIESEHNALNLLFMYNRTVTDTAILAEDTRGKAFYFEGYNPDDPHDPGNLARQAAPYLRTETLEYTQRWAQTLQLSGRHTLPISEIGIEGFFILLPPSMDWTLSHSSANMHQPDKRQFGSQYWAAAYNAGWPPWFPPSVDAEWQRPYKPAANFTVGNLQRVWTDISETSDQYSINWKIPFKQYSDSEGYVKLGIFDDKVFRKYHQESFSNFNDNLASATSLAWEDFWSETFLAEMGRLAPGQSDHPITPGDIDDDYRGHQRIRAWYHMTDLPVSSFLNVIGGVRYEKTQLSIVNNPEKDVKWLPPDNPVLTDLDPADKEGHGAADVAFSQFDVLPSLGAVLRPIPEVTLRGSYSRTVARQTFKELTPIMQQEYLGGDVFIGNPTLKMSALENYDVRMDYVPYQGSLLSVSYFRKRVKDPIEYVQRIADFAYTTAVNYPEGKLSGYEFEVRQDLGRFWDPLQGFSAGANATLIDSRVTLPDDEADAFEETNISAPMRTRDMTNAPKHLYNIYLAYDIEPTGTQLAVFYTVKGDTLVAGAGQSNGHFIPNVYELEHGTLNFSLSQKLGQYLRLQFQAKNLTNGKYEEVYRSKYIDSDVVKSAYRAGIELTLGLYAEFTF